MEEQKNKDTRVLNIELFTENGKWYGDCKIEIPKSKKMRDSDFEDIVIKKVSEHYDLPSQFYIYHYEQRQDALENFCRKLMLPREEEMKFISYSGKYPNLCSGKLVVSIGEHIFDGGFTLSSNGSCGFSNGYSEEYVKEGSWSITEFPENFPKNRKHELLELVNTMVPPGCCGGCL